MTIRPVRRALLSVSDKTGLLDLARGLVGQGVELVSTGGTARGLREAGLPVHEVAAVTGFPEILDGRVKTLHPAIHGGLLARRDDPAHAAALAEHDIAVIDLLVANLYPFEAALAAGKPFTELIEEIDIGGPAMIRAAAKNHDGVAVLTDPADYAELLVELAAKGGTAAATRRRLAAKAFARTAAYDAMIAERLAEETGDRLPDRLVLAAERVQALRYGENPHQRAAFYGARTPRAGLAAAHQLQGKELSYNNLLDADAALALVADFALPAVAIVKHTNPCGVAVADGPATAWRKALAADPVSAFGGIVALNRPLDLATAEELGRLFLEVVLAPSVEPDAALQLRAKANLRLLATGTLEPPPQPPLVVRSVTGGWLVQEADTALDDELSWRVVTGRAPTPAELADLRFAWTVVRHVKSNAIVLARDGATSGIGMGQTNRVDSVHLAARRMATGPRAGQCVCASDAFFPFPDGLLAAADAGATAVIQPGGSVRDQAVIEAADARGIAMLFTGRRHFRH